MNYVTNSNLLASAYGSGTYDTSTYDSSTSSSGSASSNNTSGSTTGTTTAATTGSTVAASTATNKGVLTDTGFDLLLIGSLAAAIICIALIARFWKRPNSKGNTE
jgi:hypothetical protein